MNAAQSQGLAGLSGALNTQAQNEKDLGYLLQLRELKKQEQAEQEQAQIAEQQYYQYLNQQADGLLASDKKKINAKALKMQAAIKEQISLHGGDRKSFFKHGGHSLLGKYVNDIAQSEEMTTYKENKTNMVRLLDAMQKGFRAQIMQKDMDAMNRYNETGEGKITYGGLLNTIDMPDSENYELGTDIPVDDIYNANRLKILANYRMENPNKTDPSEEDLLAYTSARYGGKGSNRDAIDWARRMAYAEAAKNKAGASSGKNPTDKREHNLVTYIQKALTTMTPGTAEEVLSSGTNMFKNSNNKLYQQLGLGNWKHSAQRRTLDRDGFNFYNLPFESMVNPSTRLAHSGELFKTSKNKVAEVALQSKVSEEGYVTLEPGADFYDMDGISLENNMLEKDKFNTKYKVLGISTAMKAQKGDGTGQLLMEILDDGELDQEKTMEFAKEMRSSVATPTTVVAIEHPDGHIFYKEIPLDELETSNVVSNTLGDDAVLNDMMDSQQLKNQIDQTVSAITAQEQQQIEQTLIATEQALAADPFFNQEVSDFTDKQNGESRANLMAAYYASVPDKFGVNPIQAARGNQFSVFITGSGADAESLFRNYENNLSDEEMILQWLDIANRNVNSSTIQNNNDIARRWITALRNYNDLNL
ncbi:MAG: hypothetical protein EX254_09225 [Flavobacteriaceae bacterium]|nr:MAG: hypothetical protein EX254_09225 [Flavobacteriaceae bacterium]